MAQITLYIDDQTQARLREAAARRQVSQSQFVGDLIRKATAAEWPPEVLALAGAIPDFPLAEELRAGLPPEAERDFGMIYALDTNTVSYYLRRQGNVVQRLQAMEPQRLAIPSAVVFEVNYGLRRVGRENALASFAHLVAAVRTLDFDADAADHAARIRVELEAQGMPIGLPDLLIAATARRHGCTLVTHNTREFSRVPGLGIEDWY